MIKNEVYNKRQEIIINTIDDIVKDTTKSKAVQSHNIMKLLRNECLFVSKEYLASANHKDYATLDPHDEGVKNVLSEEDVPYDWFPVFGNSFGPFDPIRYFESPIKVLWLLKEPLIKKESWIKGDRGAHDQAKENRLWVEMEDNESIQNLIEITRTALSNILGKAFSEQDAMYQICILEVNHFPGLYFKNWESDETSLREWGNINHILISKLVDFYDPTIIFFASTLDLLDRSIGDFKYVQERYNSGNFSILDDEIVEWSYVSLDQQGNPTEDKLIRRYPLIDKNQIKHVGRNIKYLGKSGKIYIQAYHPTYQENDYINPNKKDVLIGFDSDRIKRWILPETRK